MTAHELNLLQGELLRARTYLEFGSGNSTRMAASLPHLQKMTVVESDDAFFQIQVRTDEAVRKAMESGRLDYRYINVGKTGAWGYPLTAERMNTWPDYSSAVFRRRPDYDLILVDGRFRVACILQACLKCGDRSRILVHDFFNRPAYFVVLPFLNLVCRVDTFGLFKPDVRRVKRYRSLIRAYIGLFQYQPDM
ncbi:hypothetical protein [uncultured Mediterranea sp.]|uniref:hypothetical protein n=1 Tax=uncultured Mediterranea sp. TaxID=1926662 RepID=UPI0027D9ADB8|nr:hypothetical protein [uncultured Mediterranea sp.]